MVPLTKPIAAHNLGHSWRVSQDQAPSLLSDVWRLYADCSEHCNGLYQMAPSVIIEKVLEAMNELREVERDGQYGAVHEDPLDHLKEPNHRHRPRCRPGLHRNRQYYPLQSQQQPTDNTQQHRRRSHQPESQEHRAHAASPRLSQGRQGRLQHA
jgi:hypothetical protein